MSLQRKVVLQVTNLLTPLLCGLVFIVSGVQATESVFTDTYPKLLSPAGFTFAIWGPIFIFQAAFYFYQARDLYLPAERKLDMPYVEEVGPFFPLSWLSTTVWFILWAAGLIWPAIAAMYAYLLTTLAAYLRLGINLRERSLREHLFVTVGWSMLAGWVTAATIVNTTTGLVSAGFNPAPIGEAGWTIVVLTMTLIIYLLVLFTRNDYVFAGVGGWALLGILAERLNPANSPQPEVTLFAAAALCAAAVIIIVRFVRRSAKSQEM
ncbi:MAG: hypothetical protein HXY34_07630 [Candidatus Thorarchaeota archaeon]|nr:hypothetical protein [Candidatus Thorarchaeota archaeon]